jgi:acetyl esterase/lipase
MTINLSAWLAAATLVLTACGSDGKMEEEGPPGDNDEPDAATGIEVTSAVEYCSGGDVPQLLDLAKPAAPSSSPRPGILFVHGGGWSSGDRSLHSADIEEAARRGYVAATIDYRLAAIDELGQVSNPFPTQLFDVKCAIRWMRSNADELGVDPSRIGLVGASAGAHLSLLAGLTGDDFFAEAEELPGVSNEVQVVVNVYGPTDLIRLYQTSPDLTVTLQVVFSGDPTDSAVAELYAAASPATYVYDDMIPVLTMHGTADLLVPYEQATTFDALTTSVSADHTLISFEGEGHGFSPDGIRRSLDEALDFLDRHLD